MKETLLELYGHQAWADAEHWKAFKSYPSALREGAIRERLCHIHIVQRAFLSIVSGTRPSLKRLEDFSTMEDLREYARDYHREAHAFLDGLPEASLAKIVVIPWFKDPPISITIAQALLQAAMHSQAHRAQNALRLREIGGKPPTTDLIMWYWKGQPSPDWSQEAPSGLTCGTPSEEQRP